MIVFSQVTKQFGDNPPAVEEVTFSVEEGEFLFLTGHSGSGKTTLLKLLTKEYLPSDGDIEFEGVPLSKVKNSKLHHHRRKIGVVYQDYRLLPELNVWENVALALEIIGKPQSEIEERVTDLLELVQLTDKAYSFPSELSGGESQRVGIARALATAPNVLLADEPTGNLDPENTLMIARLFDKIHELGTTIFFATHDVTVLETLGHRRLKMEKGRLIEDTPAKPTARKSAKKTTSEDQPKESKTPEKKATKLELKDEAIAKEVASLDSDHPTTEAKPEPKKRRFPSINFPLFKRKPKVKEEEKVKKNGPKLDKQDGRKEEPSEKLKKTEKLDLQTKEEKVEKRSSKTKPPVDIMIEEL